MIVDMAAEMIEDERPTDWQEACYFVSNVFNRPIPQWMIDYQAELKETEDEWREANR